MYILKTSFSKHNLWKDADVKFSPLKASIDEEMRNGSGRPQQMTESFCENKTKCGVQTRYMESHLT